MSTAPTDDFPVPAISADGTRDYKAIEVSPTRPPEDFQRPRKLAPKTNHKRSQAQEASAVANTKVADTDEKFGQGSEVDRELAKDQKGSQDKQYWRSLQYKETQDLHKACCRQLRTAYEGRTSSQVSYVACVLTVTLNSFRALKKGELDHAVDLYLRKNVEDHPSSAIEKQPEQALDGKGLSSIDNLVREGPNGEIVFVLPALASFLKVYRVAGIDPTHRTIAGICILQRKVDAKARGWVKENGDLERKIVVESPFSAYAEEYGDQHIREVSRQGLRL